MVEYEVSARLVRLLSFLVKLVETRPNWFTCLGRLEQARVPGTKRTIRKPEEEEGGKHLGPVL